MSVCAIVLRIILLTSSLSLSLFLLRFSTTIHNNYIDALITHILAQMDTVLNIGLNDTTVEALAKATGSPRFAYDSYRRLVDMYGK